MKKVILISAIGIFFIPFFASAASSCFIPIHFGCISQDDADYKNSECGRLKTILIRNSSDYSSTNQALLNACYAEVEQCQKEVDDYTIKSNNYYQCFEAERLEDQKILEDFIQERENLLQSSCPAHSSYNLVIDECECSYGYIDDDSECIFGRKYCDKYYGKDYRFENSTYTCIHDPESAKINRGTECVNQFGKHAFYNANDLSCLCYQPYLMTDDGCIEQKQVVIPNNHGQVLGTSYPEDNPLNLESGWLIKNREFVEVFSVDENLCLHWIINEEIAEKNFGVTWNHEGNIKEFDKIPSGYEFCENLK